jgi:hypothetical protein
VSGARLIDGLSMPVGSPDRGVLVEELLVPRFERSILSSPTAPLVPGIEVGLLDVLLPWPTVPGDAVAPEPAVALPVPLPVPIPVLPLKVAACVANFMTDSFVG